MWVWVWVCLGQSMAVNNSALIWKNSRKCSCIVIGLKTIHFQCGVEVNMHGCV